MSHYLHNQGSEVTEKRKVEIVSAIREFLSRKKLRQGLDEELSDDEVWRVAKDATQLDLFANFFDVPFPAPENPKFTFIDLFAGIGGFRIAFQNLGGKCVYNNHCCITGISNSLLLEACHISGWSDDTRNRTNPKNGLCMIPTFHRAYDKFLVAITPDYEVVISEKMIDGAKDDKTQCYLASLQHQKMLMPEKFSPDVELLSLHYEAYLKTTG